MLLYFSFPYSMVRNWPSSELQQLFDFLILECSQLSVKPTSESFFIPKTNILSTLLNAYIFVLVFLYFLEHRQYPFRKHLYPAVNEICILNKLQI